MLDKNLSEPTAKLCRNRVIHQPERTGRKLIAERCGVAWWGGHLKVVYTVDCSGIIKHQHHLE